MCRKILEALRESWTEIPRAERSFDATAASLSHLFVHSCNICLLRSLVIFVFDRLHRDAGHGLAAAQLDRLLHRLGQLLGVQTGPARHERVRSHHRERSNLCSGGNVHAVLDY